MSIWPESCCLEKPIKPIKNGAGDEVRTRDNQLGKLNVQVDNVSLFKKIGFYFSQKWVEGGCAEGNKPEFQQIGCAMHC